MEFLKPISDDSRVPLPPGTVIIDQRGIRYKIKNAKVSGGGNALIYRVERENTLRNLILKECYPRSREFNFFRNKDGVVCAEDDDDARRELTFVKENMRRESKICQIISRTTGRIIGAWENLIVSELILDGKTFDISDSCFVVMEQATDDDKKRGWFLSDLLEECAKPVQVDAPLRNGGLPSPYVATCIIEQLLKSLKDIHAAKYLHGDISDGNFFMLGCDSARGDIGIGQLLDFGNALKLDSYGKTEPIDYVFSTDSYGAPEIFERKNPIQLTRAADIFSIGCLMVYLFKGFEYKKIYNRNVLGNFSVDTYIPLTTVMSRGYHREAALVFRKILDKALRRDPLQRYQTADKMLDDIVFLKKIIHPPKFTLPRNLTRSPYFVQGSRDEDIYALQKALDAGTHPLWIWGVGGIGKSELAMEFARKQIENGRATYLVTFSGSLEETIMNMNFSGWHFESDSTSDSHHEEYEARLVLLRENYENALLIIDNFDSDNKTLDNLRSEPAYRDLLGLGIKILFTTRSRPDEKTLELEPLSEKNCLKLFKDIAKFSTADEPIICNIIHEVDNHTMTVDMLARTLKATWRTLTAEKLLDLLRQGKLDSTELPEIIHKKNFTEREAKVYGHLRTLFKLVYSDEYRDILCDLTLIPPDGFDAADFLQSVSDGKKNT